MKKKTIILTGLLSVAVIATLTLLANNEIKKKSGEFIFSDIESIEPVKTGLLLGTSKLTKQGRPNLYFINRINAAVELYNKGKIRYIIVSGDNSTVSYNEPQDMKDGLIARGIPEEVIYLDYAGFRTFDSVIRAKEIFGQDEFIVISQRFHNERAIYIARQNGIEATGYNADDVSVYGGFKTKLRELIARDWVFVDEVIGTQPKFLGEKILF